MFSQLGPLFKAQFRQAESNDTRQYIPHEERDQNRKKQDEQKKKNEDDTSWTDDASVSVLSLRAFLIDFLKTLPGGEDYNFIDNKNAEGPQARPKEKSRPTSTYSAKAVRAYQTMATHAQNDSTNKEQERSTPKDNNPTADKLLSKEIRDIHALITNLEALEKRGVTTLHILKASSFVEGMKQAIIKENQNFKT